MISVDKRDIVVIGASAGGVIALKELVGLLPADFQATIFVVQHVAPYTKSHLPEILSQFGPLQATHPKDGEKFRPGHIYIAPPDHHLLVEADQILVKKGPKENRFRPSVDALFRSAAYTFGPRVIGVVLTGLLNDGTSGMWSIKRCGGSTIIQEPGEAMYPSMPLSVLEYVDVDYTLPLAGIASKLVELINEVVPQAPEVTPQERNLLKTEIIIAAQHNAFEMGILNMGSLTPFTCPECNGTLVRFQEGKFIRYRCHTGHAFTASALLTDVSRNVEETLWKAVRGLEEVTMLLDQTATAMKESGDDEAAELFFNKAHDFRERADYLHEFAFQQEQLSEDQRYELPPEEQSN